MHISSVSGALRALAVLKTVHNPEPCLITVDADDGQALPLEAGPEGADVLELLIAVWAGVDGDLLAVDAQGEMHLVQKASDRVGRDRDADLLEDLGNLLRRFSGPLQPGDGVSGRIVFQQNLDGIDYFGRFFSTGLRPAPALRARSPSTSWVNNCCRPRATVCGSRPRKSAS